MKIKNIDRALFIGLFVGTIIFIKEFFFPANNSFLSIIITAFAAFIASLMGFKIFPREDKGN